jgi:hypothetical protein
MKGNKVMPEEPTIDDVNLIPTPTVLGCEVFDNLFPNSETFKYENDTGRCLVTYDCETRLILFSSVIFKKTCETAFYFVNDTIGEICEEYGSNLPTQHIAHLLGEDVKKIGMDLLVVLIPEYKDYIKICNKIFEGVDVAPTFLEEDDGTVDLDISLDKEKFNKLVLLAHNFDITLNNLLNKLIDDLFEQEAKWKKKLK